MYHGQNLFSGQYGHESLSRNSLRQSEGFPLELGVVLHGQSEGGQPFWHDIIWAGHLKSICFIVYIYIYIHTYHMQFHRCIQPTRYRYLINVAAVLSSWRLVEMCPGNRRMESMRRWRCVL